MVVAYSRMAAIYNHSSKVKPLSVWSLSKLGCASAASEIWVFWKGSAELFMQFATGESIHVLNEIFQIQVGLSRIKWHCMCISSIWRLFFFFFAYNTDSEFKVRELLCDKGINLFGLNDTVFLTHLAAEAILWEKQVFRTAVLWTCLEIYSKSKLKGHCWSVPAISNHLLMKRVLS